MAMPQKWLSTFGSEYYSHAPLLGAEDEQKDWNAQSAGIASPHQSGSSEAELEHGIASIIATMKGSDEGE